MRSSLDKQFPKKRALLLIDVQEKIIKQIFNKDLITKNIKKLLDAYQILEENIYVSEQNPLKLGETIPELLPKSKYKKFEKMEFSLANREEFIKEIENKKITTLLVNTKKKPLNTVGVIHVHTILQSNIS